MLFLCFLLTQEGYFLDGTQFRLKDGSIYKTISEVHEDTRFYSWSDGGYEYVFLKTLVEEKSYFSVYVYGPPPVKLHRTTREKRISGQPVCNFVDKKVHFRVLHVDLVGRSLAGKVSKNVVQKLDADASDPVEVSHFNFEIHLANPDYLVTFSFFDFEGKPVVEKRVDLEPFKIKKKKVVGDFWLEQGIDPSQIGLLEVSSIKKSDQ